MKKTTNCTTWLVFQGKGKGKSYRRRCVLFYYSSASSLDGDIGGEGQRTRYDRVVCVTSSSTRTTHFQRAPHQQTTEIPRASTGKLIITFVTEDRPFDFFIYFIFLFFCSTRQLPIPRAHTPCLCGEWTLLALHVFYRALTSRDRLRARSPVRPQVVRRLTRRPWRPRGVPVGINQIKSIIG